MQQFVDRTTDDKQIKYVIRKYIKFTLLGFSGGWYTSRMIGWLSCGGKPVCKYCRHVDSYVLVLDQI